MQSILNVCLCKYESLRIQMRMKIVCCYADLHCAALDIPRGHQSGYCDTCEPADVNRDTCEPRRINSIMKVVAIVTSLRCDQNFAIRFLCRPNNFSIAIRCRRCQKWSQIWPMTSPKKVTVPLEKVDFLGFARKLANHIPKYRAFHGESNGI